MAALEFSFVYFFQFNGYNYVYINSSFPASITTNNLCEYSYLILEIYLSVGSSLILLPLSPDKRQMATGTHLILKLELSRAIDPQLTKACIKS